MSNTDNPSYLQRLIAVAKWYCDQEQSVDEVSFLQLWVAGSLPSHITAQDLCVHLLLHANTLDSLWAHSQVKWAGCLWRGYPSSAAW